MDEITNDKDSMDALQSLLQIRSRGCSTGSPSSPSRHEIPSNAEKFGESSEQSGEKKHGASNNGSPIKKKNSNSILHGNKRSRIDQHESPSNGKKLKNQPIQPIQPQIQPKQQSTLFQSHPSASNLIQSPHHHRGLFFPSAHQVSSLTSALGSPMSHSSSFQSLQQQHANANTAMAHIQLVAAQAAMVAAASAVASVSNGQRMDTSRMLSPQQQQPIAPTSTSGPTLMSLDTATINAAATMDSMEEASSSSSTITSGSSSNIRREKVEAALRSKPQRGKKREDLSAKERLELTRTRNREHAKTTRIRKKARYQELLDCESKLQIILQEQATEELQRKAVETFVSLKQNMIRCSCQGGTIGYDYTNDHLSSSTPSLEAGVLAGSKENGPSSSPVPPPPSTTKPVDHASILAKLVHNVNQFNLQVSPKMEEDEGSMSSSPTTNEGQQTTPFASTMNTLKAMDRQLVDRAVERYGVGAQQYFVCQVSEGGIALTTTKSSTTTTTTAMAEIELHMELTPCNRTHLQTCLLKATFSASQPVLLQSVSWTILEDRLTEPQDGKTSSSPKATNTISSHASTKQLSRTVSSTVHKTEDGNNSIDSSSFLQSQSVFPSIVSLEQSKAASMIIQASGGGGGSSSSSNDGTSSLGMPL